LGEAQVAHEPSRTDRIRESDPETALALRRAQLARQRGRHSEAERIVIEALDRDPGDVPALSMLSEILRAKGDLVGAVAAAQRATDADADGTAPPGSVSRAREQRAQIEETVVREVAGPSGRTDSDPLSMLLAPVPSWCRSRGCYAALGALGFVSLLLATVAALKGQLTGHLWLGTSLVAAGWAYSDAENRKLGGLFWGPLVLSLGPFGLAIYLLATY
jgi:hypothetical protein